MDREPKVLAVSRRGTVSSSKALPKPPQEIKAPDRVTALQVELQDLARQRNNMEAAIRRMTELMPGEMTGLTSTMDFEARMNEMARRDAEKKKVEGLKAALADIKKEAHELGLKLHRALKKADERAVYEPTGLWVRRVTG
jgi:hypothetical protein